MKRKYTEAIFFISFFLIVSGFVITFNINLFFSTLLYFILPLIYLGLKYNHLIKKILLFLEGTLLLGGIIEILAINSLAWCVPTSIFPYVFIFGGKFTLEEFIWAILAFPTFILIYKNFIDVSHETSKIKKISFITIAVLFIIIVVLFALIIINKKLMKTVIASFISEYFFIKLGLLMLIADIFLIYRIKYDPKKLLKIVLVFSPWLFLYEIIAIKNGFWVFPGKYLATISIFGSVLPIEEIVFWVVLGVPTLILFYENFFK